ncbi:MAG: hypothetical protein H0X65_00805 [Gemmatimonadetes bacterium]|nr:hypothetical protein [Gemmatimonadota bacterium]
MSRPASVTVPGVGTPTPAGWPLSVAGGTGVTAGEVWICSTPPVAPPPVLSAASRSRSRAGLHPASQKKSARENEG